MKMMKIDVIVRVLLICSASATINSCLAQNGSDSRVPDYLQNDLFLHSNWNSELECGFGVLTDGNLLFLEGVSNNGFSMNAKFMINNPGKGVLDGNQDYWAHIILKHGRLVLTDDEFSQLELSMIDMDLNEDDSSIYVLVSNSAHTIFYASVKETDMTTAILKIHINNY